ncbi:VOC family protein [Paenisporosarcina indica]|uniref:VOC family protein n=1 Tax=Paenisporosarcina indica TaxID=650093 RepID=UPI00094F7427|nr:VOC family protein [Paenisporosarcina indica]
MMELDHVVYFSNQSPEEHVLEHKGTSIGGRHKNWGTINALTYTKNSYIEYLSVENIDVAKQSNHPLIKLLLNDLKDGEGWGTICVRVNQIHEVNERLCSEGLVTSGVIDAERETTSGFVRKWKMLFIEQDVSDELPYPFFIEWEEPFEERMQSLREDGTLQAYNESLLISQCVIAVKDPTSHVKEWAKILNVNYENHTIVLSNTKIVFQHNKEAKDRLKIVDIVKCN